MKWWIYVLSVAFVAVIGVIVFYPFYPLKYFSEIRMYAEEFDLKPEFVASVINAESGFDERAVSSKGAIGLMQLMPSTAQEIAEKLEFDNYSDDMLYDPDVNIRFGCYYLRYLSDRFQDDTLVLASYNAGMGVVYKWLNNEKYSSDGELIKIPYKQTDEYVKKVNKALPHYEKEFNRRNPKISA